jgi:hypothetical protein
MVTTRQASVAVGVIGFACLLLAAALVRSGAPPSPVLGAYADVAVLDPDVCVLPWNVGLPPGLAPSPLMARVVEALRVREARKVAKCKVETYLQRLGEAAQTLQLPDDERAWPCGRRPIYLMIGANVGPRFNEPGYHLLDGLFHNWTKIMVEPTPTLFKKLVENVRTSGLAHVTTVNAAIVPDAADAPSSVAMYCFRLDANGEVDKAALQALGITPREWFNQMCSMNRSMLLSAETQRNSGAAPALIERVIERFDVPALSVRQLLEQYTPPGSELGYVQIDVEGFDDVLVQSLPLQDRAYRHPPLLVYEHVHIPPKRDAATHVFLAQHGYSGRCIEFQNTVHLDGGW